MKTYPREIGVLQVPKKGEKLAGVYMLLKRERAGLETVLKGLFGANVGVRSVEMYERDDADGWVISAFLDMSKSPYGASGLENFLKRLDCVDELAISEHTPILHQTSLFPIMNRNERVILQSVKRIQHVRDQLERILTSSGVSVIFYNMGLENGRGLHKMLVQEFRANLLTIQQRANLLKDHLVASGMGILDLTDLDLEERSGIVKLYEGYECDGVRKDRPTCHASRGILAGYFGNEWAMDNVKAVELRCRAIGDPHCEFAVGTPGGG